MELVIKDLHANIGDKEILKGVNLTVTPGTIHAIMGPNGSGKSTLSNTIMGHPSYTVTSGEVLVHSAETSLSCLLMSAPNWDCFWHSSTPYRSPV
jgi:Fe-S cluster assembly ATPase SufC